MVIEGAQGTAGDTDLEDPEVYNLIKFVGETSIGAGEYASNEFSLIA